MINIHNVKESLKGFWDKKPFPYTVIENFFTDEIAQQLSKDFPKFDSESYNGKYFNQIEIKKSGNVWDRFPPTTYKALSYLNSPEFVSFLEKELNSKRLYSDNGLHGGGWHTHPSGGKLNVHLDYSIHPKLGLQRKFNLIVYLNSNYQSGWGGELGLWDSKDNKPNELIEVVEPVFNRAVIFETTTGWHGLEVPNKFPENECRNSLAVYYLTDPDETATDRNRALFSPSKEQENDIEVLELIKRRSGVADTSTDPELWSRK